MGKHTALPWVVHCRLDENEGSLVRPANGDTHVAECSSAHTGAAIGEDAANAAFIVRACNSYGPLLEALEEITRFHASGGHEGRWSEVEAKANAAIALARGEVS